MVINMITKKYISVLLVMLLLLSAILAGCEQINEPPPPNGIGDENTGQAPPTPGAEPTDAPPEDKEPDNQEPAEDPAHSLISTSHGLLALSYIEHINDAFYDRLPFSDRELETAIWIVEELLLMGYDENDIELQTFHRSDVEQWLFADWEYLMWGMFRTDGLLRMYSQNVILTVPGQVESTIIVGAHYDGLIWPGGNDNASGTALLLESASSMLELDNYYTIEYVFFGAEEIGLLGARYYYDSLTAQQRDNIVMMVNADVLLSGEFLMYGAGFFYNDGIIEDPLSLQVNKITRNLHQQYGIGIAQYHLALYFGSDHLVFLENGHTAVYFLGVHLVPRQGEGWFYGTYDDQFITVRALHSDEDCIHFIRETWPGLAETNMWSFSLFLEALLMASYD
jgi:hypothetical protein